MTDEEIKKIAREYAEYCCRETNYEVDIVERNMDLHICADEVAMPLLEWLSKDYCIVPKSKLNELVTEDRYYQGYNGLLQTFPEDLIPERTDWRSIKDYADGLYYLIEDIMSLFEEDKE